MKKLIAMFSLAGLLIFGTANVAYAQNKDAKAKTEQAEAAPAEEPAVEETTSDAAMTPSTDDEVSNQSFHQVLKTKFIEGGVEWMTPILLAFILGLALVIERIIYLNLATTNAEKLLKDVEAAIEKGGVNAAKDVCRDTKGPVASIFYQGLDRIDEGIEMVEKSIVSYGGVAMARLERNLGWISLVVAIAPMLGFLGTVVGMVQAFDAIEVAGDISPTVVAGGMKVALLTTVFGLIVALIIQVFYSYLSTKIESLVATMEDSSITFMDILVKHLRNK